MNAVTKTNHAKTSPGIQHAGDRPQVYVGAALLATLICVVGFWPTYFGPMFLGTFSASWVIHIHGAVQVTWLALFIAQVVFAGTGHLDWHLKVGRWAMAFSVVVLFAALVMSFDTFGRDVAMGEAARGQRRLFGFLREVFFVAPFLAAGWIYRNKPETHKRLMIVATVIMSVPAVGRMKFLGTPPTLWQFMLVWPLPVYALMIYDYLKKRHIHPVYVIGVVAMLLERLVLPLRTTDTWIAISSWFVPFYQSTGSGG